MITFLMCSVLLGQDIVEIQTAQDAADAQMDAQMAQGGILAHEVFALGARCFELGLGQSQFEASGNDWRDWSDAMQFHADILYQAGANCWGLGFFSDACDLYRLAMPIYEQAAQGYGNAKTCYDAAVPIYRAALDDYYWQSLFGQIP